METKDGGLAAMVSETTTTTDGDGLEIAGFGAWFGNVDLGGDLIRPGAFAASLKDTPQVPILWQHDTREPIGKTTVLKETEEYGLFFKARLTLTRRGQDARLLLREGVVSGCSIGYDAVNPRMHRDGYRELHTIKLYEISMVTWPLNPKATVLSTNGAIRDKLLIASVEADQARGCRIPQRKMVTYLAAMERELERATHGGKTLRELLYDLAYELQEASK